ncbi:hypothetical protein DdX_16112 [Ditylenchus destructor]|uniref:Uncharacterized protein n=1 Tax=Ditylenchus destructor TaxID=166010 RepID=A0AAD4MPA5_9BILA|nr:hypothetical protein DdX_16112 [Ditylenchus destructor]
MQLSLFLIIAVFISDCIGPDEGQEGRHRSNRNNNRPHHQSAHDNHGNRGRVRYPSIRPDMKVIQMVEKRPDMLFRILEAFAAAIGMDTDLTYLTVDAGKLNRFLPRKVRNNAAPTLTSPSKVFVNGDAPTDAPVGSGPPPRGPVDNDEGDQSIGHGISRKPRSESIFIPALQKFIDDTSKMHDKDSIKVAKDILEEGTKLIREHYIVHVNPRERNQPPPKSSRFEWVSRIFDLGKKQASQKTDQQKSDKAGGGLKGLAIQVSKEVAATIWQSVSQKYSLRTNPNKNNTSNTEPLGRDAIFQEGVQLFENVTGFHIPSEHAVDYLASGIPPKDIDFRLNNFYDLIERVKLIEMKTRIFNYFKDAVKGASKDEKEKIFEKYKNFIKNELLREEAPFRFKIMPQVLAVINQDEFEKALKEYTNWDRFSVRKGYIKYNAVPWNLRLWAQLHQVKNEFDKIAPKA